MGVWRTIDRCAVRFPVKWGLLLTGFILEFLVTLPAAVLCRLDTAARRRPIQHRRSGSDPDSRAAPPGPARGGEL
jgi:hypothetical protein